MWAAETLIAPTMSEADTLKLENISLKLALSDLKYQLLQTELGRLKQSYQLLRTDYDTAETGIIRQLGADPKLWKFDVQSRTLIARPASGPK